MVMSRPGPGHLGTQAAAGMRAIVRTVAIMGSRDGQVKARLPSKRLRSNHLAPPPRRPWNFRIYARPANAQADRNRSLQCHPGGRDAGARAGPTADDGPERLRVHRPATAGSELPEYDLLLPHPGPDAPRAAAGGSGATLAWPAM